MGHSFYNPEEHPNQQPLYRAPFQEELQAGELCLQVQRYLPEIVENDGTLSPEQAIVLNAHLAICSYCSTEFARMRQVILYLEQLPMLEPPEDFSDTVLKQLPKSPPPVPPVARTLQGAAIPEENKPFLESKAFFQEAKRVSGISSRMRLILGAVFVGIILFLLMSPWGRSVLGANVDVSCSALNRIAFTLSKIPFFGWLVSRVVFALAQCMETLVQIWQAGGSPVVAGALFDIALLGACAALARNRQRTFWHHGGMKP